MNLGSVLLVEGVMVVILLGAFFGFTSLIMDKAMENTNNMITGMMTGDITKIQTDVKTTDSYMMSLGKMSTGFLDNAFAGSMQNADDNQKALIQKARDKLQQMKATFADAEDIQELEEYLNQLEQQ